MSSKLVRLRLKNFQAHADITIDFDPGVNVIVAPNDTGKSALFRAVRWVAFNRPLGDSVVRHGEKDCRAEVTTDSHRVTRQRGEANVYKVDGKTYKAFGQDVPQPVSDALRLDAINFQRQIDPPFWLSLPPPDVARELNRVVDLSVIDRSLANAAGSIRDAQADVKSLTGMLEQAEVRAGRCRWVPEAERLLEEASNLDSEVKILEREVLTLSEFIARLDEAESVPVPDLSKAGGLAQEVSDLRAESQRLHQLITAYDTAEVSLCRTREELKLAEAEVERLKPNLCPTCKQPVPS